LKDEIVKKFIGNKIAIKNKTKIDRKKTKPKTDDIVKKYILKSFKKINNNKNNKNQIWEM